MVNHYPKTTETLRTLLADTYALLVKTHNYHWNVTGPEFHTLHEMFDEQYHDLFETVDLLAERIRALGAKAPGSFAEFMDLSQIQEGNSSFSAHDMVADLLKSHQMMIDALSSSVKIAEDEEDIGSEDIFINRQKSHEKTRWMLEATLQGWKK